MRTCFISGIAGQDGAYLAKLMLEKGYSVHGGIRRVSQSGTTRLEKLQILSDVQLHEFDLSDASCIRRLLDTVRVDEFYNLAAPSFVGASWEKPIDTAEVGGMGVLRILEALRTQAPETRYYQASTSEMFGHAKQVPQSESTPLYPRSPYGTAKAFGHYITRNYRENFGMHASSGVLFNHESPLRSREFVTRKISSTLARLARGAREVCVLGNLDARRDWGFAEDYVEGMWLMLQQARSDEYVLATGVATSVRDFVNYVAGALGMALAWDGHGVGERATDRRSGRTVIEVSAKFFRPTETNTLVGDASKARAVLGWRPRLSVQELAQLMARADYDAAA